jgi:hypothetical protein
MRSANATSLALPLLGGLRRLMPAPSILDEQTTVPSHVAVGRNVSVLGRATRPGINLAIWLRHSVGGAARIAFDALPAQRIEIDAHMHRIGRGIGASLVPRTLPERLRSLLACDIDRLALAYTRLTGSDGVRIRLHSFDGDECRIFHVDFVDVRFITTYTGPGTDWLEDGAARREFLGGRGLAKRLTVDAMNNAIVSDWTRIHRLPRFAVAAFRGCRPAQGSAADSTLAIVHRSPPIAGTGIRRLRLVIESADHDKSCGM